MVMEKPTFALRPADVTWLEEQAGNRSEALREVIEEARSRQLDWWRCDDCSTRWRAEDSELCPSCGSREVVRSYGTVENSEG